MILDPFANMPAEDGSTYSALMPSLHIGIIKAITPDTKYVLRIPSVNTTLDLPPCKALQGVPTLYVNDKVLVGFIDGEFEEMYIIGRITGGF